MPDPQVPSSVLMPRRVSMVHSVVVATWVEEVAAVEDPMIASVEPASSLTSAVFPRMNAAQLATQNTPATTKIARLDIMSSV